MMSQVFIDGILKGLFVFILVSSVFIITLRHIRSLFSLYAIQSFIIAILAFFLYTVNHEKTYLYIAVITLLSKSIIIPWFMRKIHKKMKISRDVEFYKLTPISSIIVSLLLVILSYQLVSKFSVEILSEPMQKTGAVLGISLTFIGFLILFSRKQTITKTVGYLTMENGVLLFSLFFSELPFIVETLIILDLLMLIMLVTILAFGIDSTMERFHNELNPLRKWFGRGDDK
jgi:hydrogenase-4 component E